VSSKGGKSAPKPQLGQQGVCVGAALKVPGLATVMVAIAVIAQGNNGIILYTL
jgi:hypothetical protein